MRTSAVPILTHTDVLAQVLRHTCEQNEGMAGYGWTAYDPREGGIQAINDTENRIDITTHFVKVSDDNQRRGWGLRLRGDLRSDASTHQKSTVILYLGSEDPKSEILCDNAQKPNEPTSAMICAGTAKGCGSFEMKAFHGQTRNKRLLKASVHSMNTSVDDIWKGKSIFEEQLLGNNANDGMIFNRAGAGNLHFLQLAFEGSFEFDVLFSDQNSPIPTAERLTDGIERASIDFNDRFKRVYWPQPPFQEQSYVDFSQFLLSNLMGGIGYFHGTSRVETSFSAEDFNPESAHAEANVEEQGPYQLLTSVPSRPFFPRGFLWDEGFHLQIILEWDLDLALGIISSWLNLMDEDGWIAREQILGSEARSKVPPEFQTQYRSYANPPTLFLVMQAFHEKLTKRSPYSGHPSRYLEDLEIGKTFLEEIYLKMKKYFEWFRRTQAGKMTHYATFNQGYRWRGRTSQHILTSGLDDYPRAQSLSPHDLHIDALSWVGLMVSVLAKISTFLGEDIDRQLFSNHREEIVRSVDGIHWSELDQAYCDTAVVHENQMQRICHKGYISLLPFLTGLSTPDHPHLGAVLDLMHDPEGLWSPYGLRSLSRNDKFYGTGENYWRSPIWININYMALVQLLDLAQQAGPYQQTAGIIYAELRTNLVYTVYNSWKETGFAWEQYNPDTGKGQRTQHFTGWTALIVKIMTMPHLPSTMQSDLPIYKTRPIIRGAWHRETTFVMISFLSLGCLALRKRFLRLCSAVWK